MQTYTKEKAVKMAQKVLSDKREVVRWLRSGESYEMLSQKGIVLGRIGK